jgi:hypothetical protein
MGIISQDTFARANQSGWGTASGGGTWTTKAGTPTLSIVSNTGEATGVTAADIALTLGGTAKDAEVVCNLQSNDMPSSSVILYIRYIDSNNFYRCGITSGTLFIDKKASGTFTGSIGSATKTINSGTVYGVRFHVQGTSLKARSWTGTEPSTWDISITDADISSAGNVGVGGFLNSSTSANQYDHFVATSLGHLLITDGYGGIFS